MARPAGYDLNPDAFADRLEDTGQSKTDVALLADVSLGTLRDLQVGRRGASLKTAHALASALRCRPGTLFPQLANRTTEAVAV